jgi:hypothetical protein
MRSALICAVFGLICLGWSGHASAQSNSPDCDICKLCGDHLQVSLLTGFSYDVTQVWLRPCTGSTCSSQEVTDDLSLPMSGGDARDVYLSTSPTVTHHYIVFKYCTDSQCSSQSTVTRSLLNCN